MFFVLFVLTGHGHSDVNVWCALEDLGHQPEVLRMNEMSHSSLVCLVGLCTAMSSNLKNCNCERLK